MTSLIHGDDLPKYMERIRAKIAVAANGCWDWCGSTDDSGYARICFRGANKRAHRVAWCAHYSRDWPEGKFALHTCDNRRCVNPRHIRPGTNAENIKEAWDRGGIKARRIGHRRSN